MFPTQSPVRLVRLLVAVVLGTAFGLPGDVTAQPPARKQTGAGPGPAAPRPRGLYAVIQWNEEPRAATWANPLLDGAVIRTYWRDVQKDPRTFDWSFLDAQLKAAADHHKRVHLIVAPGYYAPAFVLADPSVRRARFDIPAGPNQTAAENADLPLPWDEAYLAHWFRFVDQLADRFRDHPGLGYVSITGPNSHNGEMSLPRGDRDQAQWLKTAGDEVKLRALLTAAWKKAIDRFCTAFRGKRATLAVINKALPLTAGKKVQEAYREELFAYGASRHPATFGIQQNGLDARGSEVGEWDAIQAYAGKVFVGFQTRAPVNLYGGGKKATRDDRPQVLRAALIDYGLGRHADFLEIYEGDANDPALADVLRDVRKRLAP